MSKKKWEEKGEFDQHIVAVVLDRVYDQTDGPEENKCGHLTDHNSG